MQEPWIVLATLLVTLGLFIWGYWRYDVVAALALIVLVVFKTIPYDQAFIGFSNPAVITVACVMVITQAIMQSGIIDYAVGKLMFLCRNTVSHVATLCIIAAVLSAFMNNVGALALMMPIAIQTGIRQNRSPALLLMPLSFASVLGGMTTAIGTPPNLLISAYREQVIGHQFAMFDFTPVGIAIAVGCISFIAFVGWRFIPSERKAATPGDQIFSMKDYVSEVRVLEESSAVGLTLSELENLIEGDFAVIGLIRGKRRRLSIPVDEILQAKDILLIEASHEDLEALVSVGKLELVGGDSVSEESLRSGNIGLIEAVVAPGARVDGRSWQRMRIRSRYRVNLLAIARQGRPYNQRLNHVNLRAGDVVLLQGEIQSLHENINSLGLLPLQERGVHVGMPRRAILPILFFSCAIIASALQFLPVQISLSIAVILCVLTNVIPVRHLYKNIDWSIIMLLAAMIPIGGALQATGGTEMIAHFFLRLAGSAHPVFIFALLLIVTMTLSDVMNNAATAVVMAPIAVSIAQALNASIDPFLMTVAIGASCSFLTPISHQNNTLVMGPGGYKFMDYPRLGLPVELLVVMIGLPMIMWVWPI